MAQATETFAVGAEQVTVVIEFDLSTVWLISGDFSGTIPNGQVGFINGDVNLTGDLIVEGTLTGIDTFTLTGNGFQILVQNGGVLNLQGVEKSAWIRWSDTPVGWNTGDRVAVAPTAIGIFAPSEILWDAARPVNSPDVPLIDGSIAKPEVVNLSQTIVLQNLRRIHFHDGAGVASMKWLKVLNSGTTGVLTEYPIHFHLNGEASRGSVLESVVVEGGKNHAFVPHGSHGVSFPGCAAYNTTGVAFWWDLSTAQDDTNDSNDIKWDDCLVMWSKASPAPGESGRLAGYWLGSGQNVSNDRAVATCVIGGAETSGFHWPEKGGRTSWGFHDCVGHNNSGNGLFVWQNALEVENHIDDFVAYRNGRFGIAHGAYINRYQYRGAVLTGNGVQQKAKSSPEGPLLFEDILSNSTLIVAHHNAAVMFPTFYRNCTFTQVIYQEPSNGSFNRYEDCGLAPSNFVLTGAAPIRIAPSSIIEVWEAGVLEHRWASGAWS